MSARARARSSGAAPGRAAVAPLAARLIASKARIASRTPSIVNQAGLVCRGEVRPGADRDEAGRLHVRDRLGHADRAGVADVVVGERHDVDPGGADPRLEGRVEREGEARRVVGKSFGVGPS